MWQFQKVFFCGKPVFDWKFPKQCSPAKKDSKVLTYLLPVPDKMQNYVKFSEYILFVIRFLDWRKVHGCDQIIITITLSEFWSMWSFSKVFQGYLKKNDMAI